MVLGNVQWACHCVRAGVITPVDAEDKMLWQMPLTTLTARVRLVDTSLPHSDHHKSMTAKDVSFNTYPDVILCILNVYMCFTRSK